MLGGHYNGVLEAFSHRWLLVQPLHHSSLAAFAVDPAVWGSRTWFLRNLAPRMLQFNCSSHWSCEVNGMQWLRIWSISFGLARYVRSPFAMRLKHNWIRWLHAHLSQSMHARTCSFFDTFHNLNHRSKRSKINNDPYSSQSSFIPRLPIAAPFTMIAVFFVLRTSFFANRLILVVGKRLLNSSWWHHSGVFWVLFARATPVEKGAFAWATLVV